MSDYEPNPYPTTTVEFDPRIPEHTSYLKSLLAVNGLGDTDPSVFSHLFFQGNSFIGAFGFQPEGNKRANLNFLMSQSAQGDYQQLFENEVIRRIKETSDSAQDIYVAVPPKNLATINLLRNAGFNPPIGGQPGEYKRYLPK